jgi:hypothetical protein
MSQNGCAVAIVDGAAAVVNILVMIMGLVLQMYPYITVNQIHFEGEPLQ